MDRDFSKDMTPPTMRYAKIKKTEIENGLGIGMSLFVQGCSRHCQGCFNQDTWDFNGGEEWTQEVEDEFMNLISRPYVSRVSILGGEPLEDQNIGMVMHILHRIRDEYPDKSIWLYTGFKINDVPDNVKSLCDFIVDGEFILEERDISLEFRGSRNQNIIKIGE